MTLVVDSSVLVAALVDQGSDGVWAESAVASGALFAPQMVLAEVGNTLRKLEQAREISGLEATLAYRDLARFDVQLAPFAPFAERVWSLRENVTCYDAWYVALAEELGCQLMTLDRRLSRASGPTCEIVTPPLSEHESRT